MGGPVAVRVRPPIAAGRFYPADAEQCRSAAANLLRKARERLAGAAAAAAQKQWIGGIVPHAGWGYSGAVAAETLAALSQAAGRAGCAGNAGDAGCAAPSVDVVVVFGAVHTPLPASTGVLDDHERWRVPGGEFELAVEVQRRLVEQAGELFVVDERFHHHEHAVEVELPLVQAAWPAVADGKVPRLLPVEVPAVERAAEVGRETAREVLRKGLSVVFLASSDLTHYGPAFGFAPAGVGQAGLKWAMANDRRLLDLVRQMQVEQVVPEVRRHRNACGGGAVAAMLAACREAGATEAAVLHHTSSHETGPQLETGPVDFVGYASVVVG
jgi:MEMO1 family protein